MVQDGKSNWLEGVILIGLYTILAVVFWYYPGMVLENVLPSLRYGSNYLCFLFHRRKCFRRTFDVLECLHILPQFVHLYTSGSV